MKAKHLSLAIALLLAVGGLWFARSAWRAPAPHPSSLDAGKTSPDQPQPGHKLLPPDPTRKFREMTPEERVEAARLPNGIGG